MIRHIKWISVVENGGVKWDILCVSCNDEQDREAQDIVIHHFKWITEIENGVVKRKVLIALCSDL